MMSPAATPTIAASGRATHESTGLGWALWALAAALPWLLPVHSLPWTTFFSEFLAAVVFVALAVGVVWSSPGPWRLDSLALAFGVAALVPLGQALAGLLNLPGEAWLVSLYLSAMALTIAVARHSDEAAPSRLGDALFAGLAIAAIASTGIALYQWLGINDLADLLTPVPPGGRPIANVGQPNNLSTLLVWGLVAVWWGHRRARIGGRCASLAAAFLLAGVALTQSRTGWLAVAMMCVAALLGRRILGTTRQAAGWVTLALWFVVCIFALEPLSQVLLLQSTRSVGDAGTAHQRLQIWAMALEAIARQPWFGYGWNQGVVAHVGLAARFAFQETVGHAHNLLLDLVVWNGVPLGGLMVAGLALWFWRGLRAIASAEQALLMLALATFGLHAMLELPHTLAWFLLPVAAMMGISNARRAAAAVVRLPRFVVTVLIAAQGLLLVFVFDDYRQIELTILSARIRAANIVGRAPTAPGEVRILGSLRDAFATLRIEARRGMPAEELDRLRRTVTRYPGQPGLFRYAQAAALNGRPDEARWALQTLCSLHPTDACRNALIQWKELADAGNPEMAQVRVPGFDEVRTSQ